MGVVFGIYRYQRESTSEFKEWSADNPIECAGLLLDKWRKHDQAPGAMNAMRAFLGKHCPEWSRWLSDEEV